VCFGQATKVCGYLLGATKTYRVTLQLGERTASGDLETAVIEQAAVPDLQPGRIQEVLESFLGAQSQVPPMHSAIRIQGKRLYELARQGRSIERESRAITIHSIQLQRWSAPELTFEVACSKGTYIRSLAEDVAQRLGTLAYVKDLRRTAVSPFYAGQMRTLEQLQAIAAEDLDGCLLPVDTVFAGAPKLTLSPGDLGRFVRGQVVAETAGPKAEQVCVYDGAGRFVGLGSTLDGGLQPSRLFIDVDSTRG
jgi:tRNA pseudouridine55 synthase